MVNNYRAPISQKNTKYDGIYRETMPSEADPLVTDEELEKALLRCGSSLDKQVRKIDELLEKGLPLR